MDCSNRLFVAYLMAIMVMGIAMVKETRGQTADCASKLVPCAEYLSNVTKPPESCCQPIRDTIRTEHDCLCKLYSNPSFFRSLNINLTQALDLPRRCGVSADTSSCKSSGSAQSPTGSLTPPSPSGGATGGDKGGTSKITWMGVPTLLFFWASIMAY